MCQNQPLKEVTPSSSPSLEGVGSNFLVLKIFDKTSNSASTFAVNYQCFNNFSRRIKW
jgi:hypothetical protein